MCCFHSLVRTLFPFGMPWANRSTPGGNLYEVVGEVAPRFELKDESNQGFKELFEDNVYLPLETMWSRFSITITGDTMDLRSCRR